jgi:dienelactone hydrolase
MRFLPGSLCLVVLFWVSGSLQAGGPRVLPAGQLPKDIRLQPLKDLDGYFPFAVPASSADWEQRAQQVRRQLLVSLGLWPMPTRTPLNAVIHGKIEREDYSVEKVYFESVPGFFVTGNLYRPKGKNGKVPGVLCPHGHWNNGRFLDQGEETVKKEIVQGAERFEEGGRSPLQARCVELARLGCVVFHYDMLGYADSIQISMEIAHGFKKQRPDMNTTENWGLFSPQAEAHLQSVMGLQTWNSIRALDFLKDLPDVDGERIACTGASGGGTQTFILGAIDPRVKVAFPAVMVSTAMQGGCTCENACLLRVGTGNVEFAGLFAPKPLGMTSADDWTKEMAAKGFPQLQQLYKLLGAPDRVSLKRGEQFGHNYNYVSRAAMYSWLNKHLQLGHREPIVEAAYQRLTQEEMSVWDAQHPAPKAADPDFERALLRRLHQDAQKQLAADRSPERFRPSHGGGVMAILGRTLAEVGTVEWEMLHKDDRGSWTEMSGLLRASAHGEEFPVVFCHPKQWNGVTVLWLTGEGKGGLFAADGTLAAPVRKLVEAGSTVMGADLFQQGEFRESGEPLTKTGRVRNTREAAAYTFGYNHTVFTHRVHDVLSAVQFVKSHERPSKRLQVAGLGGAGPIVAAARAVCGESIEAAVVDTGGFRFGQVQDIHDPNFLPGGAVYGDVPGLLALGAPGRLWVAGEDPANLGLVKEQYAQAPKNLAGISSAQAAQTASEVLGRATD